MKHRKFHAYQPASRRKNMNLEFIASNLADALHDLRHLLDRLGHPDLNVSNLSLEHILYHLLLAWNARHLSAKTR